MRKIFSILFIFLLFSLNSVPAFADNAASYPWWQIQSVDTMKYSRDTAAEKLNDSSFDKTIDEQVKNISEIGATHVAIATPYDEKFIPFLTRWVKAARKYNLKVWFRGNFSGWEGWFGFPKITMEEHLAKTKDFILGNKNLFVDGDIFSACPECENGGPETYGIDPRRTGDVEGYRRFLIEETKTARKAFETINVKVTPNFISANGDVAKLVMDQKTTAETGGVVVIDHYVATPEKLVADIKDLEKSSGGKIFLGEFGVPIPGINDPMTEEEQAAWIKSALDKLVSDKNFIGLNYWVNTGGSTQLWKEDGSPRKAVAVLKDYFSPNVLSGQVVNDYGGAITGATVTTKSKEIVTDSSGKFTLIYRGNNITVTAKAPGFKDSVTAIGSPTDKEVKITLVKQNKNIFEIILEALAKFFNSVIL